MMCIEYGNAEILLLSGNPDSQEYVMWNKARMEQILWKGYYNLKIRAWMTVAFAASWWGILYPELCFTEATCQAVVIEELSLIHI